MATARATIIPDNACPPPKTSVRCLICNICENYLLGDNHLARKHITTKIEVLMVFSVLSMMQLVSFVGFLRYREAPNPVSCTKVFNRRVVEKEREEIERVLTEEGGLKLVSFTDPLAFESGSVLRRP